MAILVGPKQRPQSTVLRSPHVTATEMLLFADIESCLHRCHTEHTIQLIITSETPFKLL